MGVDRGFGLQRDQAAAIRLAEVLRRVSDLFPHLSTDLGPVPYVDASARDPVDPRWIRSLDLLDDPAYLTWTIRSMGAAIGTTDPVVGSSLFVQGYAYRMLTLCVAGLTVGGVVPKLDHADTAVWCSRGWISNVALMDPQIYVVTDARASVRTRLGDTAILDRALHLLIDESIERHLLPLLTAVARQCRVGARLLWGNVAACVSSAFRTVHGALGDWVKPAGVRFFDLARHDLQGLGQYLDLQVEDRQGWFWERTTCCLFDRVVGGFPCSDCSRTPKSERRAAYAASLESTVDLNEDARARNHFATD